MVDSNICSGECSPARLCLLSSALHFEELNSKAIKTKGRFPL